MKAIEMKRLYWIILFLIAGLYGCLGEIIIDVAAIVIRGQPLFLYYNGWYTSWEAFILFGLAGCLAFELYKVGLKLKNSR